MTSEIQIANKKTFLLELLNGEKNNQLEIEKKKVQDAVLQLKLEYAQKMRHINYDMVLNGINKVEEYEKDKQHGWIQ